MIKAIIVDDESSGRETLQKMLDKYCPNVEVIATAESAKSGKEAIEAHQPDLVFLDIEMPYGTGFDLLESIPEIHFEVVFATAYDQYAIKAIKTSALDYLLKPINIEDLKNAVSKAEERIAKKDGNQNIAVLLENLRNKNTETGSGKIALPTADGYRFVIKDNIIRCEASGNYTHFYTTGGEDIFVSRTMKEFEDVLTDGSFCRVHKSHLINLAHVNNYIKGDGGYVVMSDGSKVEISKRKKEEFLKRINL